jgi:hypothetical protein
MSDPFYIGVDPGQAVDPTAIAAVQRIAGRNGRPLFRCGHLARLPLNTSYPHVVQHVKHLARGEPFYNRAELVLDLTGVGRPVADLFQAEGLKPVKVSITAAVVGSADDTVDDKGVHHVAKLHLVSTLQTLLHDGRLQLQADLPETPVLVLEMRDFQATVTDTGRWRFGARSGAHDDLVLALALALWRAAKRPTLAVHPDVMRRSMQIFNRPSLDNLGPSRDPYAAGFPYPWRTGR